MSAIANHGIFLVEWMPIDARGSTRSNRSRAITPEDINLFSHRLKMTRIHATARAT
jgi:hypothetical protein